MKVNKKPLNKKSYGHIPHLPGSKLGPADHICNLCQAKIATEKLINKYNYVIVQEKLDGSNVGVVKLEDKIIPITRAGYFASTSPFKLHHIFSNWVNSPKQYERFYSLLKEKERVCGEWLIQAHGTIYNLPHEPFVAFDLMTKNNRVVWSELKRRALEHDFIVPNTIHEGGPLSIEEAIDKLKYSGHGAIDKVEGAIWRVEVDKLVKNTMNDRNRKFSFIVKYVRHEKENGIYLPEVSGKNPVYNKFPGCESFNLT